MTSPAHAGLPGIPASGPSRRVPFFTRGLASVSLVLACFAMGGSWVWLSASPVVAGLVPVLVVHVWRVLVPGALPIGMIFLTGLWVDCMSHGPLGLWAFAYAAAALMSDRVVRVGRLSAVEHVVSIAATLAVVTMLLWASASLYAWRWLPPADLAEPAARVALAYLAVAACAAGLKKLAAWMFGLRQNKLREAWP
jgi:cell shape-determining protein MreD